MIKTALYLSACVILLTASRPVKTDGYLEIGAPLPKADLHLQDISGKEITLQAAKGNNGLLIIFTGNQCPYVIRNQERLHRICTFAAQNQIGVVLVNSNEAMRQEGESMTAMKSYAAAQKFSWYYVLDKNAVVADAFEADHTPECYLFDKNTRLVYKGGIDDNPGNAAAVKIQLLQKAIQEMTAGKTVTVTSHHPLGCSIKRKL